MNILFLGVPGNPVIEFLRSTGENVISTMELVSAETIKERNIDFVISYGYRRIIKQDFLDLLPGKIINLHISYLPYNRGTDPNFWSYIENTPAGVSCHLMDKGIDTGAVLWRYTVEKNNERTLRDTYAELHKAILWHFRENWIALKNGKLKPVPQLELTGTPTVHKSKDKLKYISAIQDTYLDMRIEDLINYVGDVQMSAQYRNVIIDEINNPVK